MRLFKNIIFAVAFLSMFAACSKNKELEVSIKFKEPVYELSLGPRSINLASELVIENSDAKPQFSSSDLTVATISSRGILTPRAQGKTTITAAVEGRSTQCTVLVMDVTATAINLTSVSNQLVENYKQNINVTCEPADFPLENLQWTCTSEPEGIATLQKVNHSQYSIVCTGYEPSAKITVTAKDKNSKTSSSMEFSLVPPVLQIILDRLNYTAELGDEPLQLTATFKDENGNIVEDYDHFEWSATRDNSGVRPKDIVVVSQEGLVTFVGRGTSTVKVTNTCNRSYASCNVTVVDPPVEVEAVTLSVYSKTIKEGDEFTIYASVSPTDAVDQTLTFTSSDEDIVTVTDKGKVTAIAEGEAEITVSAANGVEAVCKVIVDNDAEEEEGERIPVEGITLDTENKLDSVPQLETLKIIPFYSPAGATPETSKWESMDESIATVDEEGVVTPVIEALDPDKETWVTIKHTADNEVATINIKIVRARPRAVIITAEPSPKTLLMGQQFQYEAIVEPDLADQTIYWQCFDENGNSILNGVGFYTGLFATGHPSPIQQVGKYTIRAKSRANESIVAYTEVEVLPILIQNAELNYEDITLNVGASVNLEVTFTPGNVTDKTIIWSSSDSEVASVSHGRVKALKDGTATITATLSDGRTLECTVKVETKLDAPKVGDYYYADGTWSTDLDSNREVVGVVYSIDNLTLHDSELASDHSNCTRGAVLALNDAEKTDATGNKVNTFKWQGWRYDINAWAVSHGFMPIKGISNIGNTQVDINQEGKRLCGYNNTKAIKAFMASEDYNPDDSDVVVHLFDGQAPTADIQNTSGWYVPSIAELIAISQNRELIKQRIEAANGTAFSTESSYWSSTEGAVSTQAAALSLNGGSTEYNGDKKALKKVRYVFAF